VTEERANIAVVKFRNPRPPSGRGTQPFWVKDVREHGGTMDSLRIEASVPREMGKRILRNFGC